MESGRGSADAWLAVCGEQRSARGRNAPGVDLIALPNRSPSLSDSSSCRVIFDGVLYDRAALREQVGEDAGDAPSDAELIGHAYRRWGEDAVARIEGIFALIVVDQARGLLLCARDPFGIRPLFYAALGTRLLLSPSIDTLLAHADVSNEINRARLVDRLLRRWSVNDETYFTHVRRVPPGHVMRVAGAERRLYRYWNPLPSDGRIEWIADDEAQDRFEALLRQAVARCLLPGPGGVYMSGGLDSSTIAMVAADVSRTQGDAPPCALSLIFPETGRAEAERQRSLAAELGLPQVQLPYEDAAGPQGTLAAALEMTRTLPAPLILIWRPALQRLALQGREHGCRVVLDGDGADEALWENPIAAADLLKSLDLAGLYRLWRIYARSYHFSPQEAFRIVVWRSGASRLLPDTYHALAGRLGGQQRTQRRWRAAAMRAADSLSWLAPDPALRAQVIERLERSYAEVGTLAHGYYLRETRSRLESAEKWFREEETFLIGQRSGVPVREPFWDPDLIAFLLHVHPRVRSAGGLAKALVRRPLGKRFPHLGFNEQRKSWLGAAVGSVVEAQAGAARRTMGGLSALVDLGVIERAQARVFVDDQPSAATRRFQLDWSWALLNLEAWTRAHR